MSTLDPQVITDTPIDLVSTMSLSSGTTYNFQNVGQQPVIYGEDLASGERGPGNYAHVLAPSADRTPEWATFTVDGELWAWCSRGQTVIVMSED